MVVDETLLVLGVVSENLLFALVDVVKSSGFESVVRVLVWAVEGDGESVLEKVTSGLF